MKKSQLTASALKHSHSMHAGHKQDVSSVSTMFFTWPTQMMQLMLGSWQNFLPVMSALAPHANTNIGLLPKSESLSTEKAYIYTVALPGIQTRNIHLEIADNMIRLTAGHEEHRDKSGRRYYAARKIQQAFSIPTYTDGKAIHASLDKGLLTITIPKTDKPVHADNGSIKIAA